MEACIWSSIPNNARSSGLRWLVTPKLVTENEWVRGKPKLVMECKWVRGKNLNLWESVSEWVANSLEALSGRNGNVGWVSEEPTHCALNQIFWISSENLSSPTLCEDRRWYVRGAYDDVIRWDWDWLWLRPLERRLRLTVPRVTDWGPLRVHSSLQPLLTSSSATHCNNITIH